MTHSISRRDALKVLGGLGLAASLPLTLAGCSGTGGDPTQRTYKIGVLQLTEHPALDAANKGFIAALDESGIKYEADQQNAQNDQSACQTIATKLVNDGNDLILAIATPAAQAVAGATTEIPIVGTAITDFQKAALVKDNDKPGTNVTGSSDLTPVDDQFDLLKQLFPQAQKVGVLYCSAEANSDIQVGMAKEAAQSRGLEVVEFAVSSSNEIQQVVESMVGKVDVCYCPTDNTIAAGMQTVMMVAIEHKLPVVNAEEGQVTSGGLITYGINFETLGHMAGEMAVQILKGEAKPADMAIQHEGVDQYTLVANQDTAKKLGVDLSVLGDRVTLV